MKLLPHILGRMAFVRAESAPNGSWRTEVFLWRKGVLAPCRRSAAKTLPAAVILSGHGVVTKPEDAPIAARVRSDAATFLWSSACGRVSFVRRERIETLAEELAAEGIVPVQLFCADETVGLESQADVFARQLLAQLGWRSLLRPTARSSAFAQALVRRIGPLYLVAILLLLGTNAVLAPRLQARRELLRSELAARESGRSDDASADARRREMIAAYGPPPFPSRAMLCDAIAGAVPERVVLTRLEIEPPLKRFEAGKPLLRRENTVLIYGVASEAEDLSRFMEGLSALSVCRAPRLARVECERDGDRLTFRIETVL